MTGLPPSVLEQWPVEDLARMRRVDCVYGLPDRRIEGVLGGLLAASGACKTGKDVEKFLPQLPVTASVRAKQIQEVGRWLNGRTTAY
jgi:hypothetical protein